MNQLRRMLHRVVTLFRSNVAERDLAREIRAHLQLLEDEFIAKGMTERDARYAARREFGGVEQAKEHQRDARSFRWLAGWPMDLKLGVRMLAKSPGLTIVAVIALAVAIGAGAAYLEFTRDLLNPKLDVPSAERIVGIKVWNAQRRVQESPSSEAFALLRANTRAMDIVGAARPVEQHLTTQDGRTEAVRGVEITASAFRLMPAWPLIGRALAEEDERAGAAPVAVIGHDLWRNRFGSSPAAVGALVHLGSSPYTIVGVMPDGFAFPLNQNLWIPLKSRGRLTQVFGRLAAGETMAAVEAEAAVLAGEAGPRSKASARVSGYIESFLDKDRDSFEIAAFRAINLVFVLLLGICGANVATLVFARTAMREAEITVRTALGASRGRICAQLFAEALVLSLLAATAGLFATRMVGAWAKRLFEQGIGPAPFWWNDSLGYPTVLYAYALAVVAAAIVGLIPAMKATGPALQGRMREGAAGTSTMRFGGLWTGVIVTQAALTVIFLSTVAALGWSNFKKSAGSDVTYSREQLLTARIAVDAGERDLALRQIADRLDREPGIASVTYATAVPGTIWEQFTFELQSPELQTHADRVKLTDTLWCTGASVGDRFFETVGIPLASGRDFTSAEIRQGAAVAIVDETFVRTVLGDRSPFGVTVREKGATPGPWLEIVGVVKDASRRQVNGPDDATLYRTATAGLPLRLLVRTQTPAAPMAQRIYAAARSVKPDVRLLELRSLSQVVVDDDLPARMFLRTFTVISAIALLLATAGIYALISFTLARRTREIGIRVALGAAPRRIISGVFARAFRQIGIGVLAGALPGLVILQSLAGDVGSMTTMAGIAAILGVCAFVILVALVSCTVPLRRALRIQPTEALRMS